MKQMNIRAEAALLEVAPQTPYHRGRGAQGDPSGYGDGNV